VHPVALAVAALATSALGALGGLGGAVLLVPVLVVAGVEPRVAAPLGLISVAAASLAAAPHQLEERVVNHRLGVALEIVGSAAALTGALVSGIVSEELLAVLLGLFAIAAAVAGGRRKGVRNPVDPGLGPADVGERPGTLAGAYPLGDGVVPYRANRIPLGLVGMGVAGLIAGLSGVSGGFVKTPVTTEVMHVPVKVAAATTTFTVGVTSAVALLVFASQGRIVASDAALVAAAAIVGGTLGARLQAVLSPPTVRRLLSVLLVLVGITLIVRR
jgi:uncharacterized membrane protein YfcA